jgi:hypothetical protein
MHAHDNDTTQILFVKEIFWNRQQLYSGMLEQRKSMKENSKVRKYQLWAKGC